MGLFFKISPKEMVEIRNKIFLDKGVDPLVFNGFEKAPFHSSWNGKNNHHGCDYEFCRLQKGYLELLHVYIIKGDQWIQIELNVFELYPTITALEELKEINHIKYLLPPTNRTRMRLRADDYIWIPIITSFCLKKHKLGRYNSRRRLYLQIKKLEKLIAEDMVHIDSFVGRWHELHTPLKVDWEGNIIEKKA